MRNLETLKPRVTDLNSVVEQLEDQMFGALRIDSALKNGWFTTPPAEAELQGIPTRAECLEMIQEWDEYISTLSDVLQDMRDAKWHYWRRCFYPPSMDSVWQKGNVLVDFRIIKLEFEMAVDRAGDPEGLFKRHRPIHQIAFKTLAEEIGISPDSVSHWHSGKALRWGNPANAHKIADYYGVSLSRAFYWNIPGPLVPVYPEDHADPIVYPVRRAEGEQDNG